MGNTSKGGSRTSAILSFWVHAESVAQRINKTGFIKDIYNSLINEIVINLGSGNQVFQNELISYADYDLNLA